MKCCGLGDRDTRVVLKTTGDSSEFILRVPLC